jgi:hypothetical protein
MKICIKYIYVINEYIQSLEVCQTIESIAR